MSESLLGFRFEIGDHLTMVSMGYLAEQYREAGRESQTPQLFTVVERMAQECPGGVQRHYVCRITTAADGYGVRSMSLHKDTYRINEVELMAYPTIEKRDLDD